MFLRRGRRARRRRTGERKGEEEGGVLAWSQKVLVNVSSWSGEISEKEEGKKNYSRNKRVERGREAETD